MIDPQAMPAKDRKTWINNNAELRRMSNWAFGDRLPNLGDFTKIDPAEWAHLEWLWGGTPCQAFSIAGSRRGLKDHRGNLTLAFVGLAHELAATGSLRGFTWENVPGVLSDKDNAFGCFLAEVVGHDAPIVSPHRKGRWPDAGVVVGPRSRLAWRILNTQHFGLPQRRRRVFVVASFGNGPDPVEILFERQGLPRPAAESAGPGQDAACDIAHGLAGSGRGVSRIGEGDDEVLSPRLYSAMPMNSGRDFTVREVPVTQPIMAAGPGLGDQGGDYVLQPLAFGGNNTSGPIDVATARTAHGVHHGRIDFDSETFIAEPIGFNARQDPDSWTGRTGRTGPLDTDGGTQAIAFSLRGRDGENQIEPEAGDVAPALRTGEGGSSKAFVAHVAQAVRWAVRRLTPVECERLQGTADGFTRIRWRGRPEEECPDGPRYKVIGNSMSVDVIVWIGDRILAACEAVG
jgi:DNA (cytosine-5)-methyltransferase 1